MAVLQQLTHKAAEYSILDISEPGAGGLNIQDLDYTLRIDQSPKMLNMMVKNGAFGKRWGQSRLYKSKDKIKALGQFKGLLYIHEGNSIKTYDGAQTLTVYTSDDLDIAGIFITYNNSLYYMSKKVYIGFDGKAWKTVQPYVPTIMINCTPDGKSGDTTDNYNLIGSGYEQWFNGDGTATEYHVNIPKDNDEDTAGLDATPVTAIVGTTTMKENDGFTVNRTTGVVTFTTAPAKGQNNVRITVYKSYEKDKYKVQSCTKWAIYGGANSNRLFLAGNGSSQYFFSDTFNAAYFPYNNYATVGGRDEDITGFGLQYNVLIIFKPSEIYQVTASLENGQDGVTRTYFYSKPVNPSMGCDCPDTIKYIDNRLTWCSSIYGVCTLVSTLLADERNVMVISRNINGGYRTTGLLAESDLKKAVAIDYDGRYILCCKSGNAYAWDYKNRPYGSSTRYTSDYLASMLAWYLWDNIYVDYTETIDGKIYYADENSVKTFTNNYSDYFEEDDAQVIRAYYQTPMLDFGNFHMLKTIKKAFFEVRGDTPTHIEITYLTDEDAAGEKDPEPIDVPANLWKEFKWTTFGWSFIPFAKTFARKCSIKKVMLFGVLFENDELNRDMSLSGIRFKHTTVKEIK